jgi:hypothetical protein
MKTVWLASNPAVTAVTDFYVFGGGPSGLSTTPPYGTWEWTPTTG